MARQRSCAVLAKGLRRWDERLRVRRGLPMVFLVAAISMIVILVGSYGIASPAGLVSFTRKWQGQLGVWVGAPIRIVFGVALWRTASSSRTPAAFEVLGVISLLSGIALPIIGAERLTKLISWWSEQPATFIRGWSAVAVALGVFLFWAGTA